jgi:hypothetical protein
MTQFAMAAGGMGAMGGAEALAPSNEPAPSGTMTEEEARAIVAKAAEQGKLSEEQAQALLQGGESSSSEEQTKGIGKLWKNITGNKQS